MLNDTWFAVLNLSLEIKIMFHYTTVELQIFDDNFNCLFVLFSGNKTTKKTLIPMLLPSPPFPTWSLMWLQKSLSRRREQMTPWDLITLNYSISQHRVNNFLQCQAELQTPKPVLNRHEEAEPTMDFVHREKREFSPEHRSPWEQLQHSKQGTEHFCAPLIPQQQQAGGQAVFEVWCHWENLGWVSGVLSPLLQKNISLLVFLSYLVEHADVIWEMSEWDRIVTGFMKEAEHLQTK